MQNVATKVDGNMLWIGVDLSQKQEPTKGGKGVTLAKTGGYKNVQEAPRVAFNLHVYERQSKAS